MSDPLRFFVPAESLQSDQVVITGDPYHHLRKVLRVKPGAVILLLDGLGHCCEVQLEQLQPEQATTRVISRWQESNTTLPITRLQALPKGDKFDLILQKGTELGVSYFQPLETEHAVLNLNAARLSKRELRWQRIVTEAARQSRRPILPNCDAPLPLHAALTDCDAELKLMLWEDGSNPLREVLQKQPPRDVALLVGPEGGFSPQEADLAKGHGFIPVHLGSRILRTETAGFAVSAVLQYLYGDFGVR